MYYQKWSGNRVTIMGMGVISKWSGNEIIEGDQSHTRTPSLLFVLNSCLSWLPLTYAICIPEDVVYTPRCPVGGWGTSSQVNSNVSDMT